MRSYFGAYPEILDIELTPCGSIEGSVRDAAGKPVGGATICILQSGSGLESEGASLQQKRTDEELSAESNTLSGLFAIGDVPTGQVLLECRRRNFLPASQMVTVNPGSSTTVVVFLVNKSSRWRLVQQVLKRLNGIGEPVIDPKRIAVIVTDHATLLKSGDSQGFLLAKQVGIVVAYSGYGYRAGLLADMLASGEIMSNESELPVIVEQINPSPDFVRDREFRC